MRVVLDRTSAAILVKLRAEYSEYLSANGSMVVELNRALYGLVQSARLWHERLKAVLKKAGYAANAVDPCVMIKGTGTKQ